MLTQVLQQSRQVLLTQFRRNFGVTAVVTQKASDPIQQLFLDKIRDYSKKSKAGGGKLVDASPEVEKALQNDMDKLNRQYGATGPDFLEFPTFSFADQELQAVGVNVETREAAADAAAEAAAEADMEEANRPCWQV